VLYSVRLTVPRRGGLRAWGAVEGDFERGLAGQQDQAVTGLRVDRELRRGPDSVRVIIVAMTEASDVAEALGLTWLAVLEATGEDLAGWDLARAEADVQPAFSLAVPVPPARRRRSGSGVPGDHFLPKAGVHLAPGAEPASAGCQAAPPAAVRRTGIPAIARHSRPADHGLRSAGRIGEDHRPVLQPPLVGEPEVEPGGVHALEQPLP
jgi:hypothetical protein